MRIRRSLFLAALLACTAIPLIAQAGTSKSWTAAAKVRPADTKMIVGVNVVTIRQSTIFNTLFPTLMASEKDAQQVLDVIKGSCGIDALTAITDATVAMTDGEKGGIFLALNGVDEKKLTTCMVTVGKKMANATITAKRTGNVVEYSESGKSDKLYVGWIGADVLVIATDPQDRTLLDKWMGGKGALNADMARGVKGINAGAAMWVVAMEKTTISPTATSKGGYGSLDLAGGTLTLDGHMVLSSAKEASAAAVELNKQLAGMSGNMPPDVAKMMKSVKIAASGDEIVAKASVAEKDLLNLMGMLMGGGGAQP